MAMKKVLLAEATAAELREFARDALGMQDVKDTASKATLTAQITSAWEQDYILIAPAADDTMAARRSAKQSFADETPDNHPEKATVHINISEEKGGDRPVELSVNGKNLLVARGKDQEISWPYYIALCNTVQHLFDPVPVSDTSNGGISPEPRKVLRYPFQRVA